jgi:transcriptional regulator with XRE-family HTH domain
MNKSVALLGDLVDICAPSMVAKGDFPGFIRLLRLSREMTMLEVAAKARTSVSHLARLERGKSSPRPELVRGLAEALEVPFESTKQFADLAARSAAARRVSKERPARAHGNSLLPPVTPEEAAFLAEASKRSREWEEVEAPVFDPSPPRTTDSGPLVR